MAINLLDITSNDNDLTNNGATEVTTSLPFAASTIAIDEVAASSQYLIAGDSASLDITGNLTIECWVKFTDLPATDTIRTFIGKMGASGNRSYQFTVQNAADSYFLRWTGSDDGSTLVHKTVAWTPSINTWYHVAAVYTAAGGTVDFYVDGSQQGTQQSGLATSNFNSSVGLEIGSFNASSQFFNGKFDEVRIWNTARTGTEINDNKAIELVGNESGL